MKKSPVSLPQVILVALSVGVFASCSSSISGDRPVAADGRAMHRTGQLDEFFLEKPVNIHGLGTKAALEKLDRAYRDTCQRAGEVPLDLTYDVPAGYDRPLNFTVDGRFENAVRSIAATTKLVWKRRGNTYHFQAPGGSDRLVQETYPVPPDFLAQISMEAYDRKLPVRAAFEKRGVSFDEATLLTLSGTKLGVETRDRGDKAAISGTIQVLSGDTPLQVRLDARTFDIPAGQAWVAPANGIASQSVLVELRQIAGVRENSLPGLTTRSSEPGLIHFPAETLRFESRLLGTGIETKAEFTRKDRPVALNVEGSGSDGSTRIATATRPDGSRVVLAITPTIIDATGRPLHR